LSLENGASSGEGSSLECAFSNELDELFRVIQRVLVFLDRNGITGRAAYVVNLAVEEMATNILKYGYDDDASHVIGLRLKLQPAAIAVSLEDDGHEFDPRTAPDPDLTGGPGDRQPGGLGISLVRRLAQRMDYERRNGKNHLTILVKKDA